MMAHSIKVPERARRRENKGEMQKRCQHESPPSLAGSRNVNIFRAEKKLLNIESNARR